MNIYIVSGLSGSGKTIALQALEDMGFYCIDNLPAGLLPHFAKQLIKPGSDRSQRAAVGIDARNRDFLESLPTHLQELEQLGLDYKIIYLEADEANLIKRFSETRRKHPLTDQVTPLVEGINMERALLTPIANNAHKRIDTTYTTPHELRALIRDYAGGENDARLSLLFESFGYKHGTPLDADFVFDVRCLPNPYWQSELRNLTGLDQPVIEFLEGKETVGKMVEQIRVFIENWLPSFKSENRSYITVAVGCTGGQHRSVHVIRRLVDYFSTTDLNVQIRHRELT
ncbi:RNase adapter RapZ [Pseudomonadota bacterium]